MATFESLLFFYVLALLALPAILLGLLGKPLKWYGMCVNLIFLALMFNTGEKALYLVAFYLIELGLALLLPCLKKRRGERGDGAWIWLFVFVAVLPLITGKLAAIVDTPVAFVGVSYMTFRAVQVLLEIHDGLIPGIRPAEFSYFLLFFPSIASGPIDRYRRFLKDADAVRTGADYRRDCLVPGVWKLMTGALYNFVLSTLIYSLWMAKLPDTFWGNWCYMYAYTLFLFFNFAGYSRMAIGTGYLLGIRMPENFNMPFAAKDLKDFWARWHISLSTWFRDYVYTRFAMTSLRKKWFRDRYMGSYLGYVITMMTMGFWHGFALRYILYGVYHGLLMCLNDVLDNKWKAFKKLKKDPRWEWVCVFITFHIVCFGLLMFSGRLF